MEIETTNEANTFETKQFETNDIATTKSWRGKSWNEKMQQTTSRKREKSETRIGKTY